MLAWEESLGIGGSGRGHRDFDDFDEMDDDEYGLDEESEFAVRYLEDKADEGEEEEELGSDVDWYQLDEELPGGQGSRLPPEDW